MSGIGPGPGRQPPAPQAPAPPPPPFRISRRGGDELFDLERVAGATPVEEELAFALRTRRLLDQARAHRTRGLALMASFAADLEAAVECALTGPEPRRVGAAKPALDRLERALLGPFRQGRVTRDEAISIMRNLSGAPMSDEQRAFMADFDRQERLIRSLFRGEEESEDFKALIRRTRSAAQIGLLDQPPDVRLAQYAMTGIVQDAIRERGQKARAAYLRGLGRAYAATFAQFVLALLAYWGILVAWPASPPFAPVLRIEGTQLLLLGICIAALFGGAWLSAIARLQPDSPEVLDGIFTNTFTAPLRALFILGFGLVAILLLHKQAVVFTFGPDNQIFSSADVLKGLSASVLTGAFLGLGEAALPNAVIQRSSGLVSSIGGPEAGR